MKRFYGSAIFEGEEVADSSLTELQNIRGVEERRIESYKTEFRMQIDELNYWRADELSTINNNAYDIINKQNSLLNQYYQELATLQLNANSAIAAFLKLHQMFTREESKALARIKAELAAQIKAKKKQIVQCHRDIAQIKSDRTRFIAIVHRDYAIEYNIRLKRKEIDIAWAHADATDKIAAVIASRYYLPVFMLRCAKGPCDFCRAKYGTTGTRAELEKLKCIPPFHDDCRCWLEEVGYVIMTR